jgi:sigma-B regulation protein RsbU (phosphoserine phosphatase)
VICVPLHQVQITDATGFETDARRIGVLYLDGTGRRSLVSAATQSTLEDLAAEASIAIENARLYREAVEKARLEQEIRIAAAIQRALLPSPVVRLPYLEAAAESLPCRSVGGDFFDYLNKNGPTFGFTVGDVAGKGPPAALLSAMMQGMFAFASQDQHLNQPAAIVSRINRALCQRTTESKFVTMVLAMLDAKGRLCYCNAGHNPPFIVGRSGVRRLGTGGPAVGLLDQAEYTEETLALEPDDVIVIFSDGVTEAFDRNDDEFGEPRLLDLIQRAGARDMPGLVDDIISAVRRFTTGAVQSDDITVMAVRYLGSVHPASSSACDPETPDPPSGRDVR